MGSVPCQEFNALSSNEAIKRFARWGAHFVPMATPFFCVYCLSLKEKWLSPKMIFNRSLIIFLKGRSLLVGGVVGETLWSTISMPGPCGMNVYRD